MRPLSRAAGVAVCTAALSLAACTDDPAGSSDVSEDGAGSGALDDASTNESVPDDSPQDPSEDSSFDDSPWCRLSRELDDADRDFDEVMARSPEEIEATFDEMLVEAEELAAVAPPELAAAVAERSEFVAAVREALAEADYDFLDADLSVVNDLAAAGEANEELVETYNHEVCGIEPDVADDDLADDERPGATEDLPFGDGSFREQLVELLIAQGFSQEVSQCMADSFDLADLADLEDRVALDELLTECGYDRSTSGSGTSQG